jgi:predicted RNA-binding Zn ribbon-like protein
MTVDLPEGAFEPGPAWWYWLAGRPALDLVNTRRERWRRDADCLTSAADVVGWLVRAGLLAEPAPAPPGLLCATRELREAIDAAACACVSRTAPEPAPLALIDEWLAYAGGRPQLRPGPDGLPVLGERAPSDSPRRALGMVALDAAQLLGTAAERARIRICASQTCSARFYDRSPAGRRRWCSMELCGNVEKARRHRARGVAGRTERNA